MARFRVLLGTHSDRNGTYPQGTCFESSDDLLKKNGPVGTTQKFELVDPSAVNVPRLKNPNNPEGPPPGPGPSN